ncbi:MAG TPA: hypothetical protein VLX61_00995 [Anaerolineales bacterium]|nr:hypothetical protein [Anaerolineales bacterium]
MNLTVIRNARITKAITSRAAYVLWSLRGRITDRRGDDYGEKAVILVLVVLAGVAAFSLFGNKIVSLINQASAGI